MEIKTFSKRNRELKLIEDDYNNMSTESGLYDIFILDSNFFVNLGEAGADKKLIPKLSAYVAPALIKVPEELAKSDIPSKFREIRHLVSNYIEGMPVKRDTKFWEWTANIAKEKHMIRVENDPADIDVIVLARLLERKDHHVAVVSDDQGIIRMIREIGEFKSLGSLSGGTFLFMLAAMAKDKEQRGLLDEVANKVYSQSLTYKRKSRQIIDIQSLVSELRDTSHFVRMAATYGSPTQEDTTDLSAEQTQVISEPVDIPQADEFAEVYTGIAELRKYREEYNLFGAEASYFKLQQIFSNNLVMARTSDTYRITLQMIVGELYEHYTWAMDIHLKTQSMIEALINTETLLTIVNFFPASKEIIEDIMAVHSLLLVLNRQPIKALRIARQIPDDSGTNPTRLIALIAALLAQNYEEDYEEAKEILENFLTKIKSEPDKIQHLIDSVHRFANSALNMDNLRLAASALHLIIDVMAEEYAGILKEATIQLFLFSRVNEYIIRDDVLSIVEKIANINDLSAEKIPSSWKPKNIRINNDERAIFQGTIRLIIKYEPPEYLNEFHMIGYEENTQSIWRIIISNDYATSIKNALSIKLKGGKISNILSRSKTDPVFIRGTIYLENPAFQVDIGIGWLS